ncbi:hypothetical protein [Solidesulfovibrio sp.]|jgi:hypothetical protein|uniref:hypothetical protein n=1 Tax=Solidesulfovibrio sp. TaxID=2910990 RepID=UPI00262A685B|nr:hypothetical protein [Solidesulfovibrio sp.]
MRSLSFLAGLALVLCCALFALAKAAPADALSAYGDRVLTAPQSCLGCECKVLGCGCG